MGNREDIPITDSVKRNYSGAGASYQFPITTIAKLAGVLFSNLISSPARHFAKLLLLFNTFPQILGSQVPGANKSLILGGIFIALALTAIPSGNLASRLGNRRAMTYSLVAMGGLTALMVLIRNDVLAVGIALALGGTFSLVSNGTIPFALAMVPPDKAGLGTGIYFSGGAVASSVFGVLFSQPNSLSPLVGALIGAAAFLAAAVFVATSGKLEVAK